MSLSNNIDFLAGTNWIDHGVSIIRLTRGYQMKVPDELLCNLSDPDGLVRFLRNASFDDIMKTRSRFRTQGIEETAVRIMEMALDVLNGNYRRDQEAGVQYLERQHREMFKAPTPKCKSCGQNYHDSKFDWRGRCDKTVAKFWDKVRVLHYHRALQQRHSNGA